MRIALIRPDRDGAAPGQSQERDGSDAFEQGWKRFHGFCLLRFLVLAADSVQLFALGLRESTHSCNGQVRRTTKPAAKFLSCWQKNHSGFDYSTRSSPRNTAVFRKNSKLSQTARAMLKNIKWSEAVLLAGRFAWGTLTALDRTKGGAMKQAVSFFEVRRT